jgi:hypothetical protein
MPANTAPTASASRAVKRSLAEQHAQQHRPHRHGEAQDRRAARRQVRHADDGQRVPAQDVGRAQHHHGAPFGRAARQQAQPAPAEPGRQHQRPAGHGGGAKVQRRHPRSEIFMMGQFRPHISVSSSRPTSWRRDRVGMRRA